MSRHYKDPDLGKTKVAIDMTAAQRDTFKRACKLANTTQGIFVFRAAKEFIARIENKF